MSDSRPIAVYDSGVGGLTVARAILDLLPNEPLLYLGDSARMPYGPRSVEEIRRFALEIAAYLVSRDVKMLVVACNSVEVSAIDDVTASAGYRSALFSASASLCIASFSTAVDGSNAPGDLVIQLSSMALRSE